MKDPANIFGDIFSGWQVSAIKAREIEIVSLAQSQIGTPYVPGGARPDPGFDDFGLVQWVVGMLRLVKIKRPEPSPFAPFSTEEKADKTERLLEAFRASSLVEIEKAEIRPGDILVFRVVRGGPARHCGIMTDTDEFVYALAGATVKAQWLNRSWRDMLVAAFRM